MVQTKKEMGIVDKQERKGERGGGKRTTRTGKRKEDQLESKENKERKWRRYESMVPPFIDARAEKIGPHSSLPHMHTSWSHTTHARHVGAGLEG